MTEKLENSNNEKEKKIKQLPQIATNKAENKFGNPKNWTSDFIKSLKNNSVKLGLGLLIVGSASAFYNSDLNPANKNISNKSERIAFASSKKTIYDDVSGGSSSLAKLNSGQIAGGVTEVVEIKPTVELMSESEVADAIKELKELNLESKFSLENQQKLVNVISVLNKNMSLASGQNIDDLSKIIGYQDSIISSEIANFYDTVNKGGRDPLTNPYVNDDIYAPDSDIQKVDTSKLKQA